MEIKVLYDGEMVDLGVWVEAVNIAIGGLQNRCSRLEVRCGELEVALDLTELDVRTQADLCWERAARDTRMGDHVKAALWTSVATALTDVAHALKVSRLKTTK